MLASLLYLAPGLARADLWDGFPRVIWAHQFRPICNDGFNDGPDFERTAEAMADLGVTATYLGLRYANEYAYLQWFLEQSADTSIGVWVLMGPRCPAEPHPYDCVAWARTLAELALQYPNLQAFTLDDLHPDLHDFVTPDYVRAIIAAKDEVNPALKMIPTLYLGNNDETRFFESDSEYDGVFADGTTLWYWPSFGGRFKPDLDQLQRQVDRASTVVHPIPFLTGIYTLAGGNLNDSGEPGSAIHDPELLRAMLEIAVQGSDGIGLFTPPLFLYDVERFLSSTIFQQQPSDDPAFPHLLTTSNRSTFSAWYQAIRADIPLQGQGRLVRVRLQSRDSAGTGVECGYLFEQLLVDGQLLWESDVCADGRETVAVDREVLADAPSVEVIVRLFARRSSHLHVGLHVTDPEVDVDGVPVVTAWSFDSSLATLPQLLETYQVIRDVLRGGEPRPDEIDAGQAPLHDGGAADTLDAVDPPDEDAGDPPHEDAGAPPHEDAGGPPLEDAGDPPHGDAGDPPLEDAGDPSHVGAGVIPLEDSGAPPALGAAASPAGGAGASLTRCEHSDLGRGWSCSSASEPRSLPAAGVLLLALGLGVWRRGALRQSSRALRRLSLVVTCLAGAASARGNVVPDPSFEQGSAVWELHDALSSFDHSVSRSGSTSLKLRNDGADRGHNAGQYNIGSVQPGVEYEYRVWVRGTAVEGEGVGGKPLAVLRWRGSSGERLREEMYMWAPYGTYDWQPLQIVLQAPPGAAAIDVSFRSWYDCLSGHTHWDDVTLAPRDLSHRGSLTGTYQVEDASELHGGALAHDLPDYSGGSYFEPGQAGASVEWNDVAGGASGGERILSFRYAMEGNSKRWEVLVNGASQGLVRPLATGRDSSWASFEWLAFLQAGQNRVQVRFEQVTPKGPLLDRLDVFRVGGAGVDAGVPDAARPDTALPDTARPDTAQPDTARPDTALPDTTRPDTALPDTALPDAALPDTALPDTALPDAAGPDAAIPDAAQTDLETADVEGADAEAPDAAVLDSDAADDGLTDAGQPDAGCADSGSREGDARPGDDLTGAGGIEEYAIGEGSMGCAAVGSTASLGAFAAVLLLAGLRARCRRRLRS